MSRYSQIAFLDRGIHDLEAFRVHLRPDVEPVILGSEEDAISQISRILRGRSGLTALHFVVHGLPGELCFAAGALTWENVHARAEDWATIRRALEKAASLLLWSCHAGHGERGARLVKALAGATGASIAAASGRIGATTKGGSWLLDVRQSKAMANPPLTDMGQVWGKRAMQGF
jgi:hypothetical protein